MAIRRFGIKEPPMGYYENSSEKKKKKVQNPYRCMRQQATSNVGCVAGGGPRSHDIAND